MRIFIDNVVSTEEMSVFNCNVVIPEEMFVLNGNVIITEEMLGLQQRLQQAISSKVLFEEKFNSIEKQVHVACITILISLRYRYM